MLSLLGWAREPQQDPAAEGRRALAALLMEVMAADSQWQDAELRVVLEAMQQSLSLAADDAAALLEVARAERREPVDLYHYTNIIRRQYSYEQQLQLLAQLWQVAFADQQLDPHEEHLIRRIAELLGIRHSDFIRAKLQARDESGVTHK